MATTGVNARGLVPVRRVDGQPPGVGNVYPTGSNSDILMLGDAIFLDANGKLQRWDQQVSANAPALLGAIVGLLDSNKRPLTHQTNKQIAVSASAYVIVADDPDLIFEAEILASVAFPRQRGHFVTVVTGAPVTANGNGGQRVASPVVTAAGHPLQMIGLAPTELDEAPASANNVLVRISNHVYRRSTRLQGPLEAADA